MGRAKKIRELRKIAAALPAIESGSHKYRHPISGSELIKRGITVINREKVHPKRTYINEVDFTMETNHLKNLKRAYDAGGDSAVNHYIHSVNLMASGQVKKAE